MIHFVLLAVVYEANDPSFGPDEKALELLQVYDKVVPRAKHRKLFQNTEEDEDFANQDLGNTQPITQSKYYISELC